MRCSPFAMEPHCALAEPIARAWRNCCGRPAASLLNLHRPLLPVSGTYGCALLSTIPLRSLYWSTLSSRITPRLPTFLPSRLSMRLQHRWCGLHFRSPMLAVGRDLTYSLPGTMCSLWRSCFLFPVFLPGRVCDSMVQRHLSDAGFCGSVFRKEAQKDILRTALAIFGVVSAGGNRDHQVPRRHNVNFVASVARCKMNCCLFVRWFIPEIPHVAVVIGVRVLRLVQDWNQLAPTRLDPRRVQHPVTVKNAMIQIHLADRGEVPSPNGEIALPFRSFSRASCPYGMIDSQR